MRRKILVAGATGGVGSKVVRLLLDSGEQVRLLARDKERAFQMFGPTPDIWVGDTRVSNSLTEAVEHIDALICTTGSRTPGTKNDPEQVDYLGVANLVHSAVQAGVKHFVLVSSIAVTQTDHPLNKFGRVLDWKLKGENVLRKSGLPYTIIRPGGLTNNPGGTRRLFIAQGDKITGKVSRADVAMLCVMALDEPAAKNVTFEVVESDGQPQRSLVEYFGGLKAD